MPKPKNTIERLMTNVEKQPNGCWLWKGSLNHKGYGVTTWQMKNTKVHRLFYAELVAAVPAGMEVCHRCDVPRCCNPEHLFPGTRLDNEHDKIAKGRHRNRWTGKLAENRISTATTPTLF